LKVIKFRNNAFDDGEESYWHVWDVLSGGEFTLCGDSFEDCSDEVIEGDAYESKQGKITCPKCIAVIKLCKSIKAKDIKE
jgi:hypothetical protein